MDAMARFLAAVRQDGEHWIWTRSTTGSRSTYGVFYPAGSRQVYAHRWIYEQRNGVIPEGFHVDHTCQVPLCVNPAHLEAVPPNENYRRQRLKTCRSGRHDLTDPANVRFDDKGRRRGCLLCKREKSRDWMAADAARRKDS